ncbi:MAG: multidrug ABC transporter permease [Nitrospirae bacterium CG_4_9_14_3_um_filter_53_35]|nr:MAG: multidrug ABC transporter permease [Nitrospirae bacterium CG2_30_53_67]PIV85075.1 MAG: multidrug ABC transporter permease [Nitrospirae bacterium CG17_big_fil_post_rev_8_21_14_2_50_50_9]PIW85419.1 MAG: multidrug ABC transporter permease [Nitrospirae bacterium CG_4_8_14_3_um_filter_50_41]PIX84843.1 MAG: multidrug ABC transporter permease [Nitrospirae bacterium CG_4_10_14_3_um_filter_53_41]PJA72958.1 MAG: multidrug ABC transporter permease [Nitrospirae bacterium CG_4_9_14_3_um_filter_53_35
MNSPGFYTIFWREMLSIRKKFWKFLAGSLVMPSLYLVTFGWGLGRGINVHGLDYLVFVLPGIIALSAMNNSFSGVAVTLNISKLYYRTIEEILVSPVSHWSIALGRVLSGCFKGLFSALLLILISLMLHIQIRYNAAFFGILFLTCFIFASLGVLAAMLAKSHEDMTNFTNFVILPMSFLSGTFFPPERLPEPFATLIMVYPLTHAAVSLRSLVAGNGVPFISLLVILFYGVVLFILGGKAIKRLEL